MKRKAPSVTTFAQLARTPQLHSVNRAAQEVGIPAERLLQLCEAGFAPHYRVDGGEPKFRLGEISQWVKANLVQCHNGMPMPRSAVVQLDTSNLGAMCAPPQLRLIEHLQMMTLPPRVSGIYFLVRAGVIVYVGQSVDVHTRVLAHRASKQFDSAFFWPVPAAELCKVEGAFIRILKPELNGPGPETDECTMGKVRELLEVVA